MDVEINLVVPGIAFNEEVFLRAIAAVIEREIAADEKLLDRTTATWSKKPLWQRNFGATFAGVTVGGVPAVAGSLTGVISTTENTYNLVAKGTRSHFIFPRRAGKLLHYRRTFRAKSRPRIIGSRAGGKSGPFVHRPAVRHPGHQARLFHIEIARRRQKPFYNAMVREMRKAAKNYFTGQGSRAARRGFIAGIGRP